jgi:serine/threonine-protein kinase
VAAADARLVGQVLDGRFEVGRLVAVGGMGLVFRGHDRPSGTGVALKVPAADARRDARTADRFRHEVDVLGRLSHDNVVPVRGQGLLPDGRAYVAMAWLDGRDLEVELAALGRLPPARSSRIVGQVLDGLGAVHALGVLHRDVKPENVFLETAGDGGDRARVMDFGIARTVGGPSPLTTSGFVYGTPAYMSPEQALGNDVDGRSDLYAAGVVLYRMLSGRLPFEDRNAVRLMIAKTSRPAPRLRVAYPDLDVPAGLDRLVADLLALDAADRPADAAAARARLDEAADPPAGLWRRLLTSR